MKKLTSLAIFLLAFLVACAMPSLPLPAKDSATPPIAATAPPTEPLLTATPSATFRPDFLTAQAHKEAEDKKLEATDTSFFSFCGNNFVPEWGHGNGNHIKEIAKDWVAFECRSTNGAERFQKFVYKRGIKIWTIPLNDKTVFSSKDQHDISLDVERLSKNGKDIYLSPSYHLRDGSTDIWNPFIPLQYKTGFYRLDLETGKLDALFNPNSTPGVEFSYALSPDETYLAFAKDQEKNIFYVRNLRKETDKKVELKSNIANTGDFVWTPDSKTIIFVAAPEGWYENQTGTFIYTYSIETNQTTVLVHNDLQQRMPFPVSDTNDKTPWLQKNFLNLISAQNGLDQWKLDIRNGYIGSIATPTPQP